MTVIELKVKYIFDREHTNQQTCLLADVTLAASAACAASLIVVLFVGLLAALQSTPFPWTQFVSLADEFLFTVALLWAFLSLPGFARYFSWRALAASLKLLVERVRRNRIPLATICLPLTRFFENCRRQIDAYWRQLRQRLAQRPPNLWGSCRAPLKLFQQAALLLAP